jgi:hypothetical protein
MIRDPRFRTPDDELAVRLSRYWDALVAEDIALSEPAAALGDLAVIVGDLAELPRDPAPEDVHARARARLSADPEWLSLLTTSPHVIASLPPASNGQRWIDDMETGSVSFRPPTLLRRMLPFVELTAIAAAILLLLYVAFRPERHEAVGPIGGTPTAVPAPTPIPGVTVDGIGTVTLPAETIPGKGSWFGAWRATLEPGAAGSYGSIAPNRSVGVESVLVGTYATRSEGPMRIIRSDGSTEDVPVGTEATIGPGESILVLDNAVARTFRNPGATQAVLVAWAITSMNGAAMRDTEAPEPALALGPGVTFQGLARMLPDVWDQATIPDGPLTIDVRRLTLAPGASLPPEPEVYPTLRWVESGRLGWDIAGEGVASPASGRPMMSYQEGEMVSWVPTRPGIRVVLRNPSKTTPVVLLVVSLAPAGTAAVTPTP